MKRIAILGSTGSIGASTLDVVAQHPDSLSVVALAAGRNIELLAEQVARFRPSLVSVAEPGSTSQLAALIRERGMKLPQIESGVSGPVAVARHPDAEFVMTAMVGAIGLEPTLAAIERGVDVGIANKEPLVAAGQLCTEAAAASGARLLPVDSEHNAIFQCLAGQDPSALRRIILTCSGGPFRERCDLSAVTLEQALAHPTWSMGPKISIDSATLMNKGLEVVEAHWLFGLPSEQIDVVLHPQSVIHSMVEFLDGSMLAQLGTPDMRIPVAHALGYPQRLALDTRLDLIAIGGLTFESPDEGRFPALGLARQALMAGGTAPCVLNAANEVAVSAFLAGKIPFLGIVSVVERVLDAHPTTAARELAPILEADRWAREAAAGYLPLS